MGLRGGRCRDQDVAFLAKVIIRFLFCLSLHCQYKVQAIDRLLSLPAGDASILPGEVDDSKMNEEQGRGTENKQNVMTPCV